MLMDPPRPLVAVPVVSAIQPLFPPTDTPELSCSEPDTPRLPTLADVSNSDPDPHDVLLPLRTTIDPP